MNFKIDTKEKFSVFRLEEAELSANMTEELDNQLLVYLENPIPHLILDMGNVTLVDAAIAQKIATIQQEFYDKNASFVICCMSDNIENIFDSEELLETMNVTPTESEAWDIVQMEEIERELLSDFDEETT